MNAFVIVLTVLTALGAADCPNPGPTGTIAGTVVDLKTDRVLGFANIVVVGTRNGAMSQLNGQYQISGVMPGQYQIKVMMMGYKTIQDTVDVFADSTVTVDFFLTAALVTETQAIEVLAARKQIDVTSSDVRTSTTSQKMREMPVDNNVEAIALSTGSAKTGDELYARGGRPGEIQNQVDGIPVDDPLTSVDESKQRVASNRHSRQFKRRPPTVVTPPGNEQYDVIAENAFVDPIDAPMSTFSVDVDGASYANARRFIRSGSLPPPDAIRIEELINYFSYDYPNPSRRRPFSITTEVARCPWNSDNKLVHIGLQGRRVPVDDLPPSNLVFLIDVSGSMRPPNKLPLLKKAFRMLTDNLRDVDPVAIVCYAGRAGLALESTSGGSKPRILDAIADLDAGGSTAGAAGIRLAYEVAEENFLRTGNNRVILATDGDFNVGMSSDDELVRLIEDKRDSGIHLSVLGFGHGNLKDAKMEKLADKGNGNYHYIDDLLEARRVLVQQMGATLFMIAKDVKIQIEFNPARVGAYRLIGYENRLLAKEDFNNDRKDGGDIGAGHSVTALYEIAPAHRDTVSRHQEEYRYFSVRIAEAAMETDELLTVRFRYKKPNEEESRLISQTVTDGDQDSARATEAFRFSAAVAEVGMLLRGSEHLGDASWAHAMETARGARGDDPDGHRAEFVRLVAACRDIADSQE